MDLIGEEEGRVARAAAWLDASRSELVGLAVLLVGAVLATGMLVWSALGRPDLPAVAVPGERTQVGDGAGAVGDGAGPPEATDPHGMSGGDASADPHGSEGADPAAPDGTGSPDADGTQVTVHVAGQVTRPGLVTLPAGSRVADALDAAGGATDAADLARTNLARPLVDGEHVRILAEGEDAPPPLADGPPTDGGGDAGPDGGRVDLNRASATELESLPGIGPALAERIVAHRETHGPFREPGDLRDVSGIGERRFQDLADRVHVG